MRKIDITEKLSFEENPELVIKGKELTVNSDAPTVLRVMGIMGEDNPGVKEILQAYNLIFPEDARKTIDDMKLSLADLITVIREAINLIVGDIPEKEQ
ncbi:hypothetical protein ACTNEN_09545 [Oribacterium sp. HCP28S3_H8]|jgi:hypothetical protein|uniref:hypothetical protein n=1 Tax=Oribacterium sp. HCP28S3_H8 TaxID=3438945 RepID=UPI003F8C50EA